MVSFFQELYPMNWFSELRLSPASNIVKGSDASKLAYELSNIQLEYEVIHSKNLADEAGSNYKNGK